MLHSVHVFPSRPWSRSRWLATSILNNIGIILLERFQKMKKLQILLCCLLAVVFWLSVPFSTLERTIPFAYFRKVRSRELLISNHPFSHIHLPYSLHEIPLLACVWESDSYFDKSPVRMASDEGAIRSSGWNGIAMVISNAVDEEYASAFVGDFEGYANSARAKIAGHYIMSKGIANENPRLVIVLMDADMLVTGSPRDILEEVSQFSSKLISNAITTVVLSQYFLSTCLQFYKFDADLVFATDHPYLTYTWPEDPSETGKQIDAFFSSIAPSDISPKFVNGGLVVGYAEAVHSMLAAILEDDGKLLRSLDPKKKRDDTDDVSMMDMDQRAFCQLLLPLPSTQTTVWESTRCNGLFEAFSIRTARSRRAIRDLSLLQ